jgi:DNA ligase-1
VAEYHCTLAKTYDPGKHNVIGWLMSEKLDGVRAIWDPHTKQFMSRSWKPLNVPPSWIERMSNVCVILDGEFFMGRGRFQDTVSRVRRKDPSEEDFDGVEYWAFDVQNTDMRYELRLAALGREAATIPGVQIVEQTRVSSTQQIHETVRRIWEAGGEGVMLRNPHLFYEFKRSSGLLKVKGSIDGLAIVTGVQAGEGKHAGRMGALEVVEVTREGGRYYWDDEAVSFKVGTGFTDAEREDTDWIGEVIRWDAHERTRDGIPRHPSFRCIDKGD